MPDYELIKRNVRTMIDKGAPDDVIQSYMNDEGVTPDQLRAAKPDRSIVEKVKSAFNPAKTREEQMALMPESRNYPKINVPLRPIIETGGLIGGGILGSPTGPAGSVVGAGLGYAGMKQLSDLIEGKSRPISQLPQATIDTGKDILQGMQMEALGSSISAGLTGLINKAVQFGLPQKLYGSAMKPSTVLKPSVREARINTGLKEEIPVSKEGLKKSQKTVSELNNIIKTRMQDYAGTNVSREAALQPVENLPGKIKKTTITPENDIGSVNNYMEQVRTAQPEQIPIEQAQIFKQTINKELNEYYANLAKGKITPAPALAKSKAAMADGLREELTNVFPEIKGLNQREASLLELNKSLGQAVNRINNRELIPLLSGIALGTSTSQSVLKSVFLKAVEHPYIKSQLAIALSKSAGKTIAPLSSRAIAYGVTPKPFDNKESQ